MNIILYRYFLFLVFLSLFLFFPSRANSGMVGDPASEVINNMIFTGAEVSFANRAIESIKLEGKEGVDVVGCDRVLAIIGYGISDKIALFTKLGSTGTAPGGGNSDKRGFSYGLGAKMTLHETKEKRARFGTGFQAHHVEGWGKKGVVSSQRVEWWEYEGYGVATVIPEGKNFSPYAGLHLSLMDGKFGNEKLQQKEFFGYFIGLKFINLEPFSFGFEARFLSETAFSFSANYNFD